MKLYLSIIGICDILIIVFNSFFSIPIYEFSVWYVIFATMTSTICVIIIDLIFAGLTHRIPEKWLNANKKIFCVSKKEKNFYDKIKIKSWKEKVPELGSLCNFSKNKIAEPNNNEYVSKYMLETVYGGICHINCIIFGVLVIFIFPLKYFLCFGLSVTLVNAILNLLPIFIMRYNRYKLKILYAKNELNAKKQQQN